MKGTLSTPAARDFAYSGVEHEDEVYSVRQLAARDSDAELKSARTLPTLVPSDSGSKKKGPIVLEDEQISVEEPTAVDDESRNDDLPLAVTASIFRSASGKDDRKNDLRKDLPRPVQEEKAFVQALKESLEESIKESLKENNEPVTAERQDCRPAFARTPFIFQVRSILTALTFNMRASQDVILESLNLTNFRFSSEKLLKLQ